MSRSNWPFGFLGKFAGTGKESPQKPEGLDKFHSEFTESKFSFFEFLGNARHYIPDEEGRAKAVAWAAETLIPRETDKWGRTMIGKDTTLTDLNIPALKESHPDEVYQRILRAIIAFVVDKVLSDAERITHETKRDMLQSAGTKSEAELRQKLIDYLYSLDVK